MPLFGAGELAAMRAAAVAHMPDTAVRLAYTAGRSPVGMPTSSYVEAEEFACGVEWIRNDELLATPGAPLAVSARMRASLGLVGVLASNDRVRITAIRGEALATPIECEIVGIPLPSTSALLLELRRLDDRTA